jgi:N-methylhydantoinase B/oxoprolinase/acetone carboxylase alpha subunit
MSANIKERLDFSCALFDAAGGLVANAPHIPVHLGAMQAPLTPTQAHKHTHRPGLPVVHSPTCGGLAWGRCDGCVGGAAQEAVRFQMNMHGASIADGDVFVSNHPQLAGGCVLGSPNEWARLHYAVDDSKHADYR